MYPGCPRLAPEFAQATLKTSQASPEMFQGCPKMAPKWPQVTLKSSQDKQKVKAPRCTLQGPGSRRGSAGPRRVCSFTVLVAFPFNTLGSVRNNSTQELQPLHLVLQWPKNISTAVVLRLKISQQIIQRDTISQAQKRPRGPQSRYRARG